MTQPPSPIQRFHAAQDQAVAAFMAGEILAGMAPVQAALDEQVAKGQADEATITDLRAQLAASTGQTITDAATIATLQARIAVLEQPAAFVVYGANTGGWWSTKGENITTAHARIRDGFGGRLPAVRVWAPYDGTLSPAAVDAAGTVYVYEISYGFTAAQLDKVFATVAKNSVVVPAHEIDNPTKGVTPAAFQTYLAAVGAAHVRSGRTDVTVAIMLMGGTYDPKRWPTVGYKRPWTDWVPNPLPAGVDAIGGDLYPYSNDTAAYTIQPAIDAAKAMGVPFYVGEFGCGHYSKPDADRAKFTKDAFDLFDANAALFPVVCVYEADNAKPWPVLPAPDGTGGAPLTAAAVRDRISRVPK
jgi:hypothetical protein